MKVLSVIVLSAHLLVQPLPLYASVKQTPYTKPQPHKNTKFEAVYSLCQDKYIAEVISKSKYPYHLAAIAKVESDFKPQVIGDKGASLGMFQIQPRVWGRFNDSVESQTQKAEAILSCLEKSYGLNEAVKRYNGSGVKAKKYQEKVLSLVKLLKERESNGNAS